MYEPGLCVLGHWLSHGDVQPISILRTEDIGGAKVVAVWKHFLKRGRIYGWNQRLSWLPSRKKSLCTTPYGRMNRPCSGCGVYFASLFRRNLSEGFERRRCLDQNRSCRQDPATIVQEVISKGDQPCWKHNETGFPSTVAYHDDLSCIGLLKLNTAQGTKGLCQSG